jgi:uncharacterized Tic20 family protein
MILTTSSTDPNAAATQFENNNVLGNKRRIYVLLFVSLLQPLFIWWLTRNLTA